MIIFSGIDSFSTKCGLFHCIGHLRMENQYLCISDLQITNGHINLNAHRLVNLVDK